MRYINPYDLLELNADDPSQISGKIIQREKRNIFHEIELSDTGVICHKDINLTKSECITVIDELDDNNKKEFHFFIYQNKALNDFLCYGDLEFFEPFKAESIYKLPEFLDFISPYFAAQYDKVLGENYAQKVLQNLKKILSVKPITNEKYFEACYRTTYSILKDTDSQFNKIEDEISSGKSAFISEKFQGLEALILQKVDIKSLNSLPSYFQGIRNQTAQTIRSISRDVNNDPHNNYTVAFKLIDIANNIETDGLVKQNITKNYHVIKKNFDAHLQTLELLKKDPLMEKYLALEAEVLSKMQEVEAKKMAPNGIKEWFTRKISTTELNALNSNFDNLRKNIAVYLRAISVDVWNNFNDINLAILIMDAALSINTNNSEIKAGFKADRQRLGELKQKVDATNIPRPSPQSKSVTAASTTQKDNSGCLIAIIVLVVIGIISMIANSNNHSSSYSDTSTAPSTSLDSSTNPASTNPTTPAPSSTYDTSTATGGSTPSESQEPAYVVVSMKNGNISGCTTFEPQYNYDIANKLVITSISSDVAVKLVDFYTDKCIRFVFIIKGTTYTVRHIPEGKYYVKIAYGEDWAVKADDPKCEGHFLSDVYFKKGEDVLDFNMTPTANGYEVPSYSLQLSTYVSNGNSSTFSTNTITQNDFENN